MHETSVTLQHPVGAETQNAFQEPTLSYQYVDAFRFRLGQGP